MSLLDIVLLDAVLSGGSGGGEGCGGGCLTLILLLVLLGLLIEFVEFLCPVFANQLWFEVILCIPFMFHIADLPDPEGVIGFKHLVIGLLYYSALAGLVFASFGNVEDRIVASSHILLGVLCGWLFLSVCYKIHKKHDIDKQHYMFVSGKYIVLFCAIGVVIANFIEQDLDLGGIIRSETFFDGVLTFFKCVWDAIITTLKHSVWWM